MEMKPAYVNHPIWLNFRRLAGIATMMVETNAKTTVHAPCEENTLSAIVTPRIPAPVLRMYAIMKSAPASSRSHTPPTTCAISAMVWQ